MAILLAATIPSGCICGGLTCYSVGVSGELAAQAFEYKGYAFLGVAGWLLALPIALAVTVLTPIIAIWLFKTYRS